MSCKAEGNGFESWILTHIFPQWLIFRSDPLTAKTVSHFWEIKWIPKFIVFNSSLVNPSLTKTLFLEYVFQNVTSGDCLLQPKSMALCEQIKRRNRPRLAKKSQFSRLTTDVIIKINTAMNDNCFHILLVLHVACSFHFPNW